MTTDHTRVRTPAEDQKAGDSYHVSEEVGRARLPDFTVYETLLLKNVVADDWDL